jgi:hypothetical protein
MTTVEQLVEWPKWTDKVLILNVCGLKLIAAVGNPPPSADPGQILFGLSSDVTVVALPTGAGDTCGRLSAHRNCRLIRFCLMSVAQVRFTLEGQMPCQEQVPG